MSSVGHDTDAYLHPPKNISDMNSTAGDPNQFTKAEEVMLVLCIVCAMTAFFLNSLAMWVFMRNKSSAANSGIRILTVTEILYTATRVASDSLLAAQELAVFPTFFGIVGVALCTRNWWFAVITLCRCIAIFVPLKAKQILTLRRQLGVYLAILLPSIVVVVLRNVWVFKYKRMEMELPIFLFQAGLPVPIVLVASLVMVGCLLGAPQVNVPRAIYTIRRATRTVLALAISFACLESPGLIVTALFHAGIPYPRFLDVTSNLASILNSSANFIVFLLSSRNFKRGLLGILNLTASYSSRFHNRQGRQSASWDYPASRATQRNGNASICDTANHNLRMVRQERFEKI